jgi:phage baseplate assembly protein V
MNLLGNLLRRARLRSVREGQVQTARAEALDNDAKDDAERWQDYGFSAQPVEGQGLVINAGGHTIVLRMDRIAERPRLAAYEVTVWHKEGHRITLKAGGVVQIDGTSLVVSASSKVDINAPKINLNAAAVAISGKLNVVGAVTAGLVQAPDMVIGGVSAAQHTHGGVKSGPDNSGPMQ